jgi:5-deoxy-D-glucuronate isomerase
MSSGFDDRVKARLIGLRMAADAPDGIITIVTGSSNISLSNEASSLQETDNRNSLSDQSATSSLYNSTSSSCSSNNNAPITARR